MSEPLVSVVTIVKDLVKNDRVKWFKQAVDSVKKQTYRNIEHVIIDGASTDGTIELLDDLTRQRRITRYHTQPDTGIYDAMNKGIERAQGKYVAFLNSDDYYHNPDAVAASVAALESAKAVFSFGTVLMRRVDAKDRDSALPFYPFEAQFFFTMPFSHQSMFCRRDVLELERFDTSFKLAGDIDLIIRLYMKGYDGVPVDKEIATYRMTGASSSQTSRVYDEYLRVFKKNFSRYVALGDAEILRMLHEHVLHESMFEHVLPKLRAVNQRQYNRIMQKALINFDRPSLLKRKLKHFFQARLSGAAFERLRLAFRDYFDVDVPFEDTGYYLFNIIPLFHIKKSVDGSIFKVTWGHFNLYKRKNTWKPLTTSS